MVREIINATSATVTLPVNAAADASVTASGSHPRNNDVAPSPLHSVVQEPEVELEAGTVVHADGAMQQSRSVTSPMRAPRADRGGSENNDPSNHPCRPSSPALTSLVSNTPNSHASTAVIVGSSSNDSNNNNSNNDSNNNNNSSSHQGEILSASGKTGSFSLTTSDTRYTNTGRKGSGPTGSTRDSRLLPAYALPPPLKIDLPWDEELGQKEGSQPAQGDLSAPVVGERRGEGVEPEEETCGLRTRALSAPQMHLGGAKLHATSPTLSGRPHLMDASGTLAEAKGAGLNGASLAGTLLTYATMPGGKFDVFAAARDGQVGGDVERV